MDTAREVNINQGGLVFDVANLGNAWRGKEELICRSHFFNSWSGFPR